MSHAMSFRLLVRRRNARHLRLRRSKAETVVPRLPYTVVESRGFALNAAFGATAALWKMLRLESALGSAVDGIATSDHSSSRFGVAAYVYKDWCVAHCCEYLLRSREVVARVESRYCKSPW